MMPLNFALWVVRVQRSSRLMSMHSANALIAVPKGAGSVPTGSLLPALLIETLDAPAANDAFHVRAAGGTPGMPQTVAAGDADGVGKSRPEVRVCVLTVSDRASRGEYADETGPAVVSSLQTPTVRCPCNCRGSTLTTRVAASQAPILAQVEDTRVVPDEPEQIAETVRRWCDGSGGVKSGDRPHVVLTAGGTGCDHCFSSRAERAAMLMCNVAQLRTPRRDTRGHPPAD